MSEHSFAVGDRVILHGLQAARELNGKKGEIKEYVADQERWAVKVNGESDWKKVKPENLKPQDTVACVVIPPQGDIYYKELPALQLKERVDAVNQIIEDPHGNTSSYFHYFWLPNEQIGWMTLTCADMFVDQPVNENLSNLGWNIAPSTTMKGTVVVQFTQEKPGSSMSAFGWKSNVKYYEPYNLSTVKSLVRELAECRIMGHPTRKKIAAGDYQRLDPMPGIQCIHNEETYAP